MNVLNFGGVILLCPPTHLHNISCNSQGLTESLVGPWTLGGKLVMWYVLLVFADEKSEAQKEDAQPLVL